MSDAFEQAAELVIALDRTFGAGGVERRGAPRILHQAPLVITPVLDEISQEPLVVALHDFSAIGVGFAHARPMPPETQFLIRLPREGETPLEVLCTVRNCRALADGQFRIGAEFTRVLNQQPAGQRVQLQWVRKSTFPRLAIPA